MKRPIKTLLAGATILSVAGAMALTAAGSATASPLRFATGAPPGAQMTVALEQHVAELAASSGGEVNIRVFALSLLNFAESNAGVRDGVADMTFNLMAYFPSDFPNINMASEFSQLAELPEFASEYSSIAFTGAINEYVMLNCPACQQEVAAQNQLYMGAFSTTTYVLMCMMPLTSVEDLRGKRIRTAGAFWSRWAESVGATPVSMSINETLEGLNQGVVDCTASNTSDFVSFNLIDVVRYVHVGAPGAQFVVPVTMNIESWRGMSDAGRAALMRGQADLVAGQALIYVNEARRGRERAAELGIPYGPVSDELMALNIDLIGADLQTVAGIYQTRFGITNGAEVAAQIRELMVRWTELTRGVTTAEELGEIYYNEIFSRIDLATFGR